MSPPVAPPAETTLGLPVKYLIKRSPVFIQPDATVGEAASVMQNARIGSALVADDPPGILTDRDLRGRVLAAGLGPRTTVREVMTRPVKTLDSDAPVFTALRLMLQENIHHLALVEEGKIVGLISGSDLLRHQATSPLYLRRTLDNLADPAVLAHYSRDIASTAQTLFRGGLAAVQISQIISSLNDVLVKGLVDLAQQALGPPPTPFAWLVFGSEGRLEQSLVTDQDNALIYKEESEEARDYFSAVAKRVIDDLVRVGFPACPGGFMATDWCKPLNEWQQIFGNWVRRPEPEALLDAAIFFDFRPVAGTLSVAPLEEILSGSGTEKLFIRHMAQAALAFKPPLGFFNRIRAENGAIDVKKNGIGPVVALARVSALGAGSRERSTLERLATAGNPGSILTPEEGALLTESFHLLLHLRLRRQLTDMQSKEPLDHKIKLEMLSALERRHLKEAFVTIRNVQEDVRARLHLDRMA